MAIKRRMVIPGELICEGECKIGEGIFKEGKSVYSSVLGLLDEKKGFVRVIPITGKYMPKLGDFVVGKVEGTTFSNWDVNINSAYSAILTCRDFIREIDIFKEDVDKVMHPGDTIFAVIREITPTKKVYITMRDRKARILRGGRLVNITPAKIPRVIGKKGSMLSLIKNGTGCRILVGQNGRIWVKGKADNVNLVVKVIERIEAEAHTSGLTNNVKSMIERERI